VVPVDDEKFCVAEAGFNFKRGMVVRGCATEVDLETPCNWGWNLMVEGISAGVLMITMPRYVADQ